MSPVAVRADDRVACDVVPWRTGARQHITVVVKATLALKHGSRAELVAPEPLARDDRTFERNPTRSVEVASDLAPYRPRCDVTFVGHAHSYPGAPAPSAAVKLAVYRDGRALLERVLHVFGPHDAAGAPRPIVKVALTYENAVGGPGDPNNPVGSDRASVVDPREPARPASFAPVSRFWPARKRLVAKLDRRALEGPNAELPEAMPWEYYQAAPPELQIDFLRGDEWVVLDGLHPTLPRVQTQLPSVRAVARVASSTGAVEPVILVADALVLDGDRARVSVVWRGRAALAGSLEGSVVEAGLSFGDRPFDWAKIAAVPAEAPAPDGDEPAPDATISVITAEARAALPFAKGSGPRSSPSAAATPWAGASLSKPVASVVGEGTVAEDAGEGTIALSGDHAAAALAKPVAPFAIGGAPSRPSAAATPWGEAPLAAPLRSSPGEATLARDPPPRVEGWNEPPAPSVPRPPTVAAASQFFAKPRATPEPEAPDEDVAAVLREAGATEDDITRILVARIRSRE